MCGIVAILRLPGSRRPPTPEQVLGPLGAALDELEGAGGLERRAAAAAELVRRSDRALCGPEGVAGLLRDREVASRASALAARLADGARRLEASLDRAWQMSTHEVESAGAAVIALKDALWSLERDRLGTSRAVVDLAGPSASWVAIEALTSVHQALSALDRLEVRGRDSAGMTVFVRDHGLDLADPAVSRPLAARCADPLFRSGAVRAADGALCFVYKAAAVIGELGDNTRALRAAVRSDELLHRALANEQASAVVLGHTRWASVGIISQPNAHPLDSLEVDREPGPLVTAALNGDIDNFADLEVSEGLALAPEITTDAKAIPALVSRRLAAGADPTAAFRSAVGAFEGSVALAAHAASHPDRLLLALRGSGQALYIGLAEGCYVVASELYGVVELTDRYLRLDGETPANPAKPISSRGQIAVLDGARAGSVQGIDRMAYDGTPLPVSAADLRRAEITTRDVDRGEFPHYLLKEITEAPGSFRKTLRGKLVERDGGTRARLGPETIPEDLRAELTSGRISRVVVIGQGTAHIAGRSLAAVLAEALDGDGVQVAAEPASELSGFGLRADMSDTLVVAISQSGTTTDTNRTVDLVRARRARVIAIVNRRGSDLTSKADGVLYTSDGRDVEMSVASTKAFYAQIAAGLLLAAALAETVGRRVDPSLLGALRDLPEAMEATLGRRGDIAAAAQLAPSKRHWAVVGNGANRIAAEELRIKLSELCYKSISCDATEDKKHIDLSSEPLVLVCAAGLTGSTAEDVAKEVGIYRAHRASPIVIATDGAQRFSAALHVVRVPETHPRLGFVLAAMAGHLLGYEAALAIDALAAPLREARGAIEGAVAEGRAGGEELLAELRPAFEPLARRFFDGLRSGAYDGALEASAAVRLATLLRYALGAVPLDSYELDEGKIGTPAVVVEDLAVALTRAIEELTRPIDAIRHQAKTVTVGISRSDESLLEAPLVAAALAAGAPPDRLSYKVLRTLADLDPAVAEVTGWIRYELQGAPAGGEAPAVVVDRGGIAAGIPSRTERSGVIRGTKHTVALERQVFVTRGRGDGRTIVIIPEVKDNQTTGMTLLHVRFVERLPATAARRVLQGYRNRYAPLVDAVAETEAAFHEDRLAEIPVVELLVEPIRVLADKWRTGAGDPATRRPGEASPPGDRGR